ncbi:MAG: NADH-quinone oxidoreductase subunit NuoH, partial [Planctomycetes bacterium]|nr:NADH-quinone oxidoreductase subunit NuoH [Planctomycetota bacterium]
MPNQDPTTLVEALKTLMPFLSGIPSAILDPILMLVGATLIIVFISLFGLFAVWLERKVAAWMQCRMGPMEVGPYGTLQTLADGLKLIAKEDIIPANADKPLFILAPILAFAGVFLLFVAIPFGKGFIIADLNIGLFYLAAVGAVEVIGVIMAGWASNNKWSVFGAIRTAAQIVSYEIPIGLAFLTVVLLAGTLSMQELCRQQAGWFPSWFVFRNPFTMVAFVIYFIGSLAECKRAPFDLPEAESELVSGFHTEYSGMRFSIFFIAEYSAMYAVSAIAAVVFLGGWSTGIAPLDRIGGVVGLLLGMAA